jgi:hypothetical protein
MSTPGRRKALKALAKRKRANARRIVEGKKPILGGKKVAISTFTKKTGMTKKKAKEAVKRQRKK